MYYEVESFYTGTCLRIIISLLGNSFNALCKWKKRKPVSTDEDLRTDGHGVKIDARI